MNIRCLIMGHQWKLLMNPAIYQWAYLRDRTYLLSHFSHGLVCTRCRRKEYK